MTQCNQHKWKETNKNYFLSEIVQNVLCSICGNVGFKRYYDGKLRQVVYTWLQNAS